MHSAVSLESLVSASSLASSHTYLHTSVIYYSQAIHYQQDRVINVYQALWWNTGESRLTGVHPTFAGNGKNVHVSVYQCHLMLGEGSFYLDILQPNNFSMDLTELTSAHLYRYMAQVCHGQGLQGDGHPQRFHLTSQINDTNQTALWNTYARGCESS